MPPVWVWMFVPIDNLSTWHWPFLKFHQWQLTQLFHAHSSVWIPFLPCLHKVNGGSQLDYDHVICQGLQQYNFIIHCQHWNSGPSASIRHHHADDAAELEPCTCLIASGAHTMLSSIALGWTRTALYFCILSLVRRSMSSLCDSSSCGRGWPWKRSQTCLASCPCRGAVDGEASMCATVSDIISSPIAQREAVWCQREPCGTGSLFI